MEKYNDPWGDLVSAASAWEPGATFSRRDAVLALIIFTLERWGIHVSS